MFYNSAFSLENKNIFITGGSRGIGAAIVRTLAEAGANIAFTYATKKESAEKVLELLPKLHQNQKYKIYQLDIGDFENVKNVGDQVLQDFSTIDGVVNNAGMTKDQLILRMKPDDFSSVIQTNLTGLFYVTQFFSKIMLKQKHGNFVNISSVIGSTGNAGQSNYAASKAGLEGFTKSIALEFSSRNIRANCIAPGYITSDMTQNLNPDQLAAINSKIPLARPGDPLEIANAVQFLLSDAASYITGQTLHINGGMYLS